MKFNHLKVPGHWEHYWSRHPEGYTIMEALISWVSQVDNMVDNVNNWNEYLDNFVATFDKELQQTVTDTLSDWQQTGFLDVVISEALQWQLDDYIATNEADKLAISAQVHEIAVSVKDFGAIGDGVTDDTLAIQTAINTLNTENGGVLLFPTGTYMISSALIIPSNKITLQGRNNASTIIKAKTPMERMVAASKIMRLSIRDIQINGDLKAQVGLYTDDVGMLWVDNLVVQQCLDRGIFFDFNTWMFNLNNVYVLNNLNYGIWVGNDCAGSKMNMVVSEENGINLRIGYTRTIRISASTFQRFTAPSGGNVIIQAGWDITFDNCWFESSAELLTGETYDLKLERMGGQGQIGHTIRVLNSSFRGVWGNGSLGITKHCILDDYTDTVLENNYIDGSFGGYASGKWYENSNSATNVVGINNQISGGKTYTLPTYSMWHMNVGVGNDPQGFSDDQQFNVSRLRVAHRISLMPQSTDAGFDYDGRLYASATRNRLRYAIDGKYWDLVQAIYADSPPTSGSYKFGQLVMNTNKTGGQPLGWVCTVGGTPGTWTSFGGQATSQPSSTATDVATLKTEFNYLLDKLKSCGLMGY